MKGNPILALLLIVLVGLLITSATGAMVTDVAATSPSLVLSPSSGKAGSWAKAAGSMFSEEGDPEFPPQTVIRFNGIEVASAYGGGSFSISFQVPSGIPPGVYPVQAVRGSQSATATFTVVTLPVANFAMDPASGTGPAPLVVQFTETSTGSPTSWWWSFGDDSTSPLPNPSHTYRKNGTYSVTLTVTNMAGTNARKRTITVYEPTLMVSPLSGKAGSMVTATGSSFYYDEKSASRITLFFNGIEITRDIPMTRSGTMGSFTASFIIPADTAPGSYTVRAESQADGAETPFTVTNLAPRALIDATPPSGKAPLSVHFNGSRSYDEDGSIRSYSWNFGDSKSATGPAADHTFSQPGEYRVILTVTDNQGSLGTSSFIIRTDNTPPIADARGTPASGPDPLTVNFDGTFSHDPDGKIRSFSWDFGDGSGEQTSSTSHQYRDPGSYTTVLTVTDDLGATGKDEVVITVGNEHPVAVIGISAKSGSVPLMVTFDGSRSFDPDGTALTYSWDFGDGTTGASKTTSHTYEEEGTYDISLVVTDMHGASGRAEETVIAESPFPVVPLIGGALIIAGTAIALWYIRQQIVKRRLPSPEFHITTDSGLEYETGMKRTSDEFPDISVEVRSGIWKEGDKR
ncbi:MAG TPA: PKD domain-containing protein [Methanoregulaceae archaeon]|nr:PKD domain-containing protein [Burkholderiaceae bacterium]HNL86008.1 PKD domain-containing protein [Methanoregulaceae archaeon]HNO08036.1 PKD domain-containing protein [Methanoregulaceae archaeon]HNW80718.1 PKD domain-containing protein [Methanoregulaceae archaeon]HPS22816.1 PKD domain-containing protein [Methanoregulaceae archaeon]